MEKPQEKQENNQPVQKPGPDKNIVRAMVYELATEFAFMIALPILGLVYLGKRLDEQHHTKYFVIIGFFIALVLSTFMIGKRINIIRKRMKKDNKTV